MSGKRPDLSTEWSELRWSEEGHCSYSTRYGPTGEVEYSYFHEEYDNPLDYSEQSIAQDTEARHASQRIPEDYDYEEGYEYPKDYSKQSTAQNTEARHASQPTPEDYVYDDDDDDEEEEEEKEEEEEEDEYPRDYSEQRTAQDTEARHASQPTPEDYDYEEEDEYPRDYSEQSTAQDTGPTYASPSPVFEVISEPTRFFKIGRVFKALWAEPAGENALEESPNIMTSPFGGNIFIKMRHFVVAREMKGCCICLSMFTYNGQGTTKKGVRPEDYAAVYADGTHPRLFLGEYLTKEPFPIVVENHAESIHPMSRLNFGRIYTLEHNIKILKVGRIPDSYLRLLIDYYVQTVAGPTRTSPSSAQPSHPATLSDRYTVIDERKNKNFWKPGRVFMMVWTEPARAPPASRPGTEATRPGTANSNFQTVWLGEHVYSEIRRFVVIAEGYGNVICSPIYTYSGMATLKPNLPDPQQHAMIHTSPFPPEELSIEDQEGNITSENLSKDPIRVIRQLDTPEGDLGSLSRINYAKIYTVEKYVRVLNIGKVHVNSMEALLQSCFFARPADQPPQGPRKSKNSSSSRSKGSRDEREVRGQSSRSKYHHKRK